MSISILTKTQYSEMHFYISSSMKYLDDHLHNFGLPNMDFFSSFFMTKLLQLLQAGWMMFVSNNL